MRMRPLGRMPRSRICRPMTQAFFTAARKRLRSSASPMADPPPARSPDRRHQGTDHKAVARDVIDQTLDVIWRAVDRKMRIGEPKIDALELLAIELGVGRELEQRSSEMIGSVSPRALADDAGPHGVVKFGVVVAQGMRRSPSSIPSRFYSAGSRRPRTAAFAASRSGAGQHPRHRPVLRRNPGTLAEFAFIGRNQQRAAPPRLRRDKDVVRADRSSLPLELGANVASLREHLRVETGGYETARPEVRSISAFVLAVEALFAAPYQSSKTQRPASRHWPHPASSAAKPLPQRSTSAP